jgi:hypothetical protein
MKTHRRYAVYYKYQSTQNKINLTVSKHRAMRALPGNGSRVPCTIASSTKWRLVVSSILLIFIFGKRNYDAHSRVELGSHISKLNSQLSGHIYEVQAKVA